MRTPLWRSGLQGKLLFPFVTLASAKSRLDLNTCESCLKLRDSCLELSYTLRIGLKDLNLNILDVFRSCVRRMIRHVCLLVPSPWIPNRVTDAPLFPNLATYLIGSHILDINLALVQYDMTINM